MDLKGLGGGTWKGFSDQELSQVKAENSSQTPVQAHTHPANKRRPPQPPTEPSPPPANREERCIPQSEMPSSKPDVNDVEAVSCDSEPQSCDLVELQDKLEEQQKRQLELEADNNRKKKLLENALVQRYQKSQAESHTLEKVHADLNRLDQLVTRDVAILRDKIEEATRSYNTAKERFERAEKEYVSAKLSLATCSERKELLSHHLCAVIQENEGRKAAKLAELMEELNVQEHSKTMTTSKDTPQ